MSTFFFLCRATVFAALLGATSCKCEPDQCPAFTDQGTGYTLPAERDSLVFVNAGGERIAFEVNDVNRTGAHESGTMYNPLGPCSPDECSSSGHFTARSVTGRGGWFHLRGYFNAEGGNNGTTPYLRYQNGHLMGFNFSLPAPGDTSASNSVLLDQSLGARVYDSLIVQQRDTLGTSPDSLAVWRVYIHRPEGVVGFEDRQTGSLFYRE